MENNEILGHFNDAMRVFGIAKLPYFTIQANSRVYRCVRSQADSGQLYVKAYDKACGVDTIGSIQLLTA